MTKEFLTCPRCGRVWLCKKGKECENFENANCSCDNCFRISAEKCAEVWSLDKPEKVVFT